MDNFVKFYDGLNYMSRNLLDSDVDGTFIANALGNAAKFLNEMTSN